MDVSKTYWGRPPPFTPSYEIKLDSMLGAIDLDKLERIMRWLEENIKGAWVDRTYQEEQLVAPSFYFKDEYDAMAFKMRWL